MDMKKLLILVVCLFFTHTIFSQTERDQKIQKRVERDNPTPRVSGGSTPTVGTPQPYYGSYYNPYYNPYRRNRWDRRYYRNPRVYTPAPVVVSGGNQQPMFAMGLIGSIMIDQPSSLGVRMNVGGRQMYVFGSFAVSGNNPYSHYDNITLLDVIDWGDEYKFDFNRTSMWDVGIGMRINDKVYPTVAIGSTNIRSYMVYYDELKVLSSDGYYSINGSRKEVFSLTVGVDFHINDYVIINTGLGVSGPPKIVVGTQLKFQ